MTQEHTKAPWHVSTNNRLPYLVMNADGYAVADCKVYHGKTDIKADMDLISAAPDLLEAINYLLREYERHIAPEVYAQCEAVAQADDAIKKANGEG